LAVERIEGPDLHARVVNGGTLKDRKGMNLPGAKLSAEAITEKDKDDAAFAGKLGVDYVALSFVRHADDIAQLKSLLAKDGLKTPVIAKIEMPEALEQIDGILKLADGIMVARGDLGVEMPPEEVPLIQQELIRLAIDSHKPVIVATQMLESMIENPRPTRAEVTDVAWAAISRADAVMLSAETASGKYPIAAVEAMNRILRLVEGYQWKHGQFAPTTDRRRPESPDIPIAISRITADFSRDIKARAVMVPTRSGRTAMIAAGERPGAPIVALCFDEGLCRRLALFWGVTPCLAHPLALEQPATVALDAAKQLGLAESGENILLIWDSGAMDVPTPTMTVLTVP
ncbi:MAG: pyruvate kinase, partial [Myxococcaceae bacterium]